MANEKSESSSSGSSEPASQPKKDDKPENDSAAKKDGEKESDKQTSPGTTPALQTPGEQKYGSGGGTSQPEAPQKPGQGDKPKFFASPLARKIALERGIPLGEIKGSGPEGRIVKVGNRLGFSDANRRSADTLRL